MAHTSSTLSALRRGRRSAALLQPVAWASLLACTSACTSAFAQTSPAAGPASQTVTISGRSAANAATIAGFGDVPLSKSPFSATVITTRQLQDAGIASIADITLLDAGITDAYNAPGYWNQLAVRGFTLDARYNVRRDGLPVNAETVLPTGNKAALELLKGTSGIQAGTSAPGGLLNLVVARPTGRVRQAEFHFTEPGTLGAAVDLGDRSAAGAAFGWRVHASGEHLDPATRASRGERWLGAAAIDWRLAPGRLLEAELETSRQRQPSTPGFSLLGMPPGAVLPSPAGVDPRTNLNNQAWSLPVVFDNTTGSLRYTHELAEESVLTAHLMRQRLRTDDRIAFPFACGAENPNFDPPYSYCRDGSFDFYDFRSENERRVSDAGQLAWRVKARWGGLEHRLNVSVQATRFTARFGRQAYNWVGTGTVDGRSVVPADPSLTDENTQRTERSTEWSLQDAITLGPQWQLWAGLRHSRLERDSVRTDASRPTHYTQSFTTPWLALAWQATPQDLLYASAGQGVESEVVPNRPSRYRNAGQALPAMKSRQTELGWKHRDAGWDASLVAFDITRPAANDLNGARVIDGEARHTGLEAEAELRSGAWSLRGSATMLRARREGSAVTALNGLKPTNVPGRSLKLQAAYNLPQVPGLALLAFMSHEGERMVLPDNSIATPGWTRLDLGLRYRHAWQGHALTWRLGIDNLADKRAWKEAPYQYEHAYLYPLQPRTVHASVQASW